MSAYCIYTCNNHVEAVRIQLNLFNVNIKETQLGVSIINVS